MSKEIEAKVNDILAVACVEMIATHRGETTRDNNWVCDEWAITIKGPKATVVQPYFTGIGHRKRSKIDEQNFQCVVRDQKLRPGSIGYRNLERSDYKAKPVAPHPAGVLYSMLLDSSAADMSFNDWCSDFGYSNDSISALNTYQACCDQSRVLRSIFDRAVIEQLREALEGY